MTIRQDMPYLPDYSTWEDWNGNVLHYFGEEPIVYTNEENWQQTAYSLMGLSTFMNYAISDPAGFEDWREWVKQFVETVNGPTN